MWKIEYSREVENYLFGERTLAFQLLKVLAGLMITPDGLPPGDYQEMDGLIKWQTLDHEIYYKRNLAEKMIVVITIKPI